MLIRLRKSWELPNLKETPEEVYYDRRRFLKKAGVGSVLAGAAAFLGNSILPPHLVGQLLAQEEAKKKIAPAPSDKPTSLYPAKRNPDFTLDRKVTDETWATRYNNFYEFGFDKQRPAILAQRMKTSPWTIEVSGEVEKPQKLDFDELVKKIPLEERLYRFRCVEAWAMAVPWTGFPLHKLLALVKPLSSAKFVRFETFNRPDWGPGFRAKEYPWPYHEGLSIEEASNDLAMLVTGIYGKPMPKQNGAPIRLIVPWKYGFKSIKSIVKIEFTKTRPKTFWNTCIPHEYDFLANVNPKVPHPRWSQASERLLGTGERVPTQLYNGYAEQVADLYKKDTPVTEKKPG